MMATVISSATYSFTVKLPSASRAGVEFVLVATKVDLKRKDKLFLSDGCRCISNLRFNMCLRRYPFVERYNAFLRIAL